jgi:hypothetical protein
MREKTAILVVSGLALTSCIITNTPGFHSGYEKLSAVEQERVQFVAIGQPVLETNHQLIYAVTAKNLLGAMQRGDTTLVYIWSPRCYGRQCASLQSVQSICTKKGYHLYVVAEYYDMEQINLQPLTESPLLTINHLRYKTDFCGKYTRLFTNELRQGKQIPDSIRYARYYLFRGSIFVRAMNSLAESTPQFPLWQTGTLRKGNQ